MINVLEHPEFQSGSYNVNFIEEHPELFELKPDRDRGTKLLRYIADVTINGYSGAGAQEVPDFEPIQMPSTLDVSPASGTKQKFDELGPDKFSKWLSEQNKYSSLIPLGVMPINPCLLHVFVQSIWLA